MGRQTARKVAPAASRGDLIRTHTTRPVAAGHPLLHLQRTVGNARARGLIAQAPTQVAQRQPKPVRERDWTQVVEDCLKQTDDLLPGGVGAVEHINREVVLNQLLGKERQAFEDQIWKLYDARKFVCEAGINAMIALFYTRDYHNRLRVQQAREGLASHPELYSLGAFDKAQATRESLAKTFHISIEPGDKEWSIEDIALLAEALGKLNDNERPLIGGYRFLRWTNRCNQLTAKDPTYQCVLEDYSVCGLHLPEVITRDYTITMYDCYKTDPAEFAKKGFKVKVQPGAENIVHEIGHAVEIGRLRLVLWKQRDAKREYERLKQQADAATGSANTSLTAQAAAAKKAFDVADQALNAELSRTSVLDEFLKLTKGKPPLTDYSAKGPEEAFADAFMLFKLDPDKLKKANKPLFDWFAGGGFL